MIKIINNNYKYYSKILQYDVKAKSSYYDIFSFLVMTVYHFIVLQLLTSYYKKK